nr:reverse transcriptase domain-containing protein [Tanacetum cinerariifolium]
MSTHSSARNLFLPLDNPKLTIRRRSRADPTLLNDFEMATEGNDDLPVPDLRTMEELCQLSSNGQGGPIVPIAIQATNFGLKNNTIQQVLSSYQFHGLLGDDANKHLENFLHVIKSIKMAKMFLGKYFPPSMVTKLRNEITNFRQLTQIDTFYNGLTLRHRDTINAAAGGTFMKRRLEECYDLIKNMTAHHNDWDTSAQRNNYLGPPGFNQNQNRNNQNQNFQNQNRNQGNIHPQGNNQGRNQFFQKASHGQNPPPAYQASAYQSPSYQAPVHQPLIPQPQVVTTNEFTNFMKANDSILKNMQTNMTSLTNSNLELKNMFGQFIKMNTASSLGLGTLPGNIVTNLKEDLKGITTRSGTAYQGPTIPTTSSSFPKVVERETEVTKDTVHPTNNRSTKDVQPPVVQTKTTVLNSKPILAPIIKPVVTPVSASKPNQKPSILDGWCLALADLGASINLMPLSVWNKLSLPKLSPTCMTLELANRSISRPVWVAEDVFVKVGTFHFPADFVVVDFDVDPRVPLILGRSFLKTGRALIDVFKGKLTLCVSKEAITFNLDQTSRYSANYNDMTTNLIDIIDMACEEYLQKVLGFSDVITSSNPNPYYDPIISTSSPTLTPFGDSDFLLEEVDAFLALEDDPTSLEELKICEAKNDKSSIDEPLEVELKDLPPHLKYAFLEGDDKFPVIIAKDFSVEEKAALITVLKSHKRAITWKLSDIKGINPKFCTHKILIEDDFEPAVQHHRRVNPKIHDVIKKEVFKLLDARLIYSISDSTWVSPVYCVMKKGGFTIVENEENELILTRLVTGWHVCIDYRKLNEATRKDHFPLPFMDQILERLAGNEYYCFLDGFLGYFQFPIDLKIKKRPHSRVLTECLPTVACPLGYAMHQCEDTNLCLNWDKSPFMVKEGIVLGHEISKNGIKVDKAKVDVIAKLPHPTTVKERFQGEAAPLGSPPSRVQIQRGVFTARKPLTFSMLATIDPPGDIMARTTPPRRCLTLDSIGPLSTVMPTTWSNLVTLVNVKERFRNKMKCLKIPSKKVKLNELNELRDQAYENSLIYKEKTKRLHDSKIKDRIFDVGDRVLLFNSRLKILIGNLKTRWSGPFTITHVFPYGTVELSQTDRPNFKVNGHRLKHYFREEISKMVVPDL